MSSVSQKFGSSALDRVHVEVYDPPLGGSNDEMQYCQTITEPLTRADAAETAPRKGRLTAGKVCVAVWAVLVTCIMTGLLDPVLARIHGAPTTAALAPTAAQPRFKKIEEIRPIDRLSGRNPLGAEATLGEPDPETWSVASLALRGPDGESAEVQLVRPNKWFNLQGAHPGGDDSSRHAGSRHCRRRQSRLA